MNFKVKSDDDILLQDQYKGYDYNDDTVLDLVLDNGIQLKLAPKTDTISTIVTACGALYYLKYRRLWKQVQHNFWLATARKKGEADKNVCDAHSSLIAGVSLDIDRIQKLIYNNRYKIRNLVQGGYYE
jgi:hypothetical protein